MKADEDLISTLLKETYEGVDHPESEMSNQNVISLSDYFNKKEDNTKFGDSELTDKAYTTGTLDVHDSYFRLNIAGNIIDIPKSLNFLTLIEESSETKVYELSDNTFKDVMTTYCHKAASYLKVSKEGEVTVTSTLLAIKLNQKVA